MLTVTGHDAHDTHRVPPESASWPAHHRHRL